MTTDEIAKKVRLLRESRQMTQDDLAHAIGRHRITVARLEAGKPVQRAVLIAMASALGIPATELLDEEAAAMVEAEGALSKNRASTDYARIPIYPREMLAIGAHREAPASLTLPLAFFAPSVTRSINPRRLIATEAKGNALAPVIQAGDLVIVEEGSRIGDGMGIVATADGAEFQRGGEGLGRAVAVFRRV